jgi:hypothetical protein
VVAKEDHKRPTLALAWSLLAEDSHHCPPRGNIHQMEMFLIPDLSL